MGTLYVDALNMLLLTLRGTPTTYYGDEIGMEDIYVSYNDTQDPLGRNYGPVSSITLQTLPPSPLPHPLPAIMEYN